MHQDQQQQQTSTHPVRLGEICVSLGKLTAEQLAEALEQQRQTGQRIGDILRARGLLSERDVAEAMAAQLGVPFCDVASATIDPATAAVVAANVARTYSLLPFARSESDPEGAVRVAMLHPGDDEALDLFERLTGLRPEPQLAERGPLRAALDAFYGPLAPAPGVGGAAPAAGPLYPAGHPDADPDAPGETVESLIGRAADEAELTTAAGAKSADAAGGGTLSRALGRLTARLIGDSLDVGATDLHLEPGEGRLAVRIRVGGALRPAAELPKVLQGPLLAHLKTLAQLDVAERRLPQDGRLTLSVPVGGREEAAEARLSTLPTLHGERASLRLVARAASAAGAPALNDLGLSNENHERLAALLSRPAGLLLVAGPPASGRTTTLYALLTALRQVDPSLNILTCEDSVAYELPGIAQSAVDEGAGLSYARQLRAALLQDPDVILIGELTDAETAAAACRAAARGHRIVAGIRADDAAMAAARLLGMGVPPYAVGPALSGAVGQRLVRKLCLACRAEARPTGDEAARLALATDEAVYAPVGCPECGGTGYRGVLALHEVLVCDGELARAIKSGEDASGLRSRAVAGGMVPLVRVAASRVRAGLTSPAEALRALPAV